MKLSFLSSEEGLSRVGEISKEKVHQGHCGYLYRQVVWLGFFTVLQEAGSCCPQKEGPLLRQFRQEQKEQRSIPFLSRFYLLISISSYWWKLTETQL